MNNNINIDFCYKTLNDKTIDDESVNLCGNWLLKQIKNENTSESDRFYCAIAIARLVHEKKFLIPTTNHSHLAAWPKSCMEAFNILYPLNHFVKMNFEQPQLVKTNKEKDSLNTNKNNSHYLISIANLISDLLSNKIFLNFGKKILKTNDALDIIFYHLNSARIINGTTRTSCYLLLQLLENNPNYIPSGDDWKGDKEDLATKRNLFIEQLQNEITAEYPSNTTSQKNITEYTIEDLGRTTYLYQIDKKNALLNKTIKSSNSIEAASSKQYHQKTSWIKDNEFHHIIENYKTGTIDKKTTYNLLEKKYNKKVSTNTFKNWIKSCENINYSEMFYSQENLGFLIEKLLENKTNKEITKLFNKKFNKNKSVNSIRNIINCFTDKNISDENLFNLVKNNENKTSSEVVKIYETKFNKKISNTIASRYITTYNKIKYLELYLQKNPHMQPKYEEFCKSNNLKRTKPENDSSTEEESPREAKRRKIENDSSTEEESPREAKRQKIANESSREANRVTSFITPKTIGIQNRGNDCFLISIFQAFIHCKIFDLLKLKDPLSDFSQELADFKTNYEDSEELTVNQFRKYLGVSPNSQEDVPDVIQKILNFYETKNINFNLCTKTKYDIKNKQRTNKNPSDYSIIDKNNETILTRSEHCINIPLNPNLQNQTFQNLLDNYVKEVKETCTAHFVENDTVYSTNTIYRQEILKDLKDTMIVSLNRFDNEQKKIKTPISIENGTCNINGETYCLQGYIVHIGDTSNEGHYITCCKTDNSYTLFNDNQTKNLSKKEFLENGKNGYTFILKKLTS